MWLLMYVNFKEGKIVIFAQKNIRPHKQDRLQNFLKKLIILFKKRSSTSQCQKFYTFMYSLTLTLYVLPL
jgi:hypothetical protein